MRAHGVADAGIKAQGDWLSETGDARIVGQCSRHTGRSSSTQTGSTWSRPPRRCSPRTRHCAPSPLVSPSLPLASTAFPQHSPHSCADTLCHVSNSGLPSVFSHSDAHACRSYAFHCFLNRGFPYLRLAAGQENEVRAGGGKQLYCAHTGRGWGRYELPQCRVLKSQIGVEMVWRDRGAPYQPLY